MKLVLVLKHIRAFDTHALREKKKTIKTKKLNVFWAFHWVMTVVVNAYTEVKLVLVLKHIRAFDTHALTGKNQKQTELILSFSPSHVVVWFPPRWSAQSSVSSLARRLGIWYSLTLFAHAFHTHYLYTRFTQQSHTSLVVHAFHTTVSHITRCTRVSHNSRTRCAHVSHITRCTRVSHTLFVHAFHTTLVVHMFHTSSVGHLTPKIHLICR